MNNAEVSEDLQKMIRDATIDAARFNTGDDENAANLLLVTRLKEERPELMDEYLNLIAEGIREEIKKDTH